MILLMLLVILAVLLYIYMIRPFKYWHVRNVKFARPTPIFGNFLQHFLRKESGAELSQRIYNTAPNERYVGLYQFTKPILVIKDPALIKQICIKDFDTFPNHTQITDENADPLWGKNLVAMRDDAWRSMRSTLSPAFTTSKMRAMFTLMDECALQFVQHFLDNGRNTQSVEMKDVFTRYTNDVIATCAFGVKCDSLAHKSNEFYLQGKTASDFSGIMALKFFGHSLSPTLMKLLNVKIFSNSTSSFFRKVIVDTIEFREKKGIRRPDLINLLTDARKGKLKQEDIKTDTGFATAQESLNERKTQEKVKLSDNDIVAQGLLFFIAGFETAATLMCFLAYELATNPYVQTKLIKEVDKTLRECDGKLTYEALMEMKYLDMVLSETLRKWPPTNFTDRVSTKDYTIPHAKPGGKDLTLPKGSTIFVPIYSIQRDPQYYRNPDNFDPERFSDQNKHEIDPFTYIPFGAGPRNCIGSRFALQENKTIIFHILSNFEIIPLEKTNIPMVLSTKHFNIASENGMWLGLKPRKSKVYY